MKIVIVGGTGQVGRLLVAHWHDRHEVVVLSRRAQTRSEGRVVPWDGKTLGEWAAEVDGAPIVVNLAGRSVNCRYTQRNLAEMYDSRIDSTRVVGQAIENAARPPALWLQMSTATIYAHTMSQDQSEATGELGGNEPNVPRSWDFSIQIARDWESEQLRAATPNTRKVALRSAMVMTPDEGGIYRTLASLARKGLGGPIAGGGQYMSWIHGVDFVRALDWIMQHDTVEGPVNLAAPHPLPQREFMSELRSSLGIRLGLPATRWMAKLGAIAMGTDTELVFKSRRVVPQRLLEGGFRFEFADWPSAARDLARLAF